MGLLHAAIFNKLDGCHLSAICDTNELMLKFVKNGNDKINTFTNFHSMLEQTDLDIVVIATPVFLHEAMATMTLRSGKHVLIEKPLAKTIDECSRVVNISNSTKSLVGYCRRYMPTYIQARELVRNEEFGGVLSYRSHFLLTQVETKGAGWQYDPYKSGGGALMDLGCHAIDMIHFILGPIASVSCKTERRISETVEDIATLDLVMETGILGNLTVSWEEPGYRLPEMLMEISCERGMIRVAEKYLETISIDGQIRKMYKQTFHDPIPFNIGGREYTAEDIDLVQSIRDDIDTRCPIEVGSMPNAVIDSAYTSARIGQEQKVSYL